MIETARLLDTRGPNGASSRSSGDVVEIPLLLPSNQAAALLELSRQRQQSIGQILRAIIHREVSGILPSPSFAPLGDLSSPCKGSPTL